MCSPPQLLSKKVEQRKKSLSHYEADTHAVIFSSYVDNYSWQMFWCQPSIEEWRWFAVDSQFTTPYTCSLVSGLEYICACLGVTSGSDGLLL